MNAPIPGKYFTPTKMTPRGPLDRGFSDKELMGYPQENEELSCAEYILDKITVNTEHIQPWQK